MAVKIVTTRELADHDLYKAACISADAWKKVLIEEYGPKDFDSIVREEYNRLSAREKAFSDGQIVAYWDELNSPVGMMNSFRINASSVDDVPVGWNNVTGNGTYSTHVQDGNMLVCASITVIKEDMLPKEYRDEFKTLHISKQLVDAQLKLAIRLGVENMIAYSRPANYAKNRAKYPSLNEYLEAVKRGDVNDPIGMHLHFGAAIWKVLPNARKDDDAGDTNIIMRYPLKNASKSESTQKSAAAPA